MPYHSPHLPDNLPGACENLRFQVGKVLLGRTKFVKPHHQYLIDGIKKVTMGDYQVINMPPEGENVS